MENSGEHTRPGCEGRRPADRINLMLRTIFRRVAENHTLKPARERLVTREEWNVWCREHNRNEVKHRVCSPAIHRVSLGGKSAAGLAAAQNHHRCQTRSQKCPGRGLGDSRDSQNAIGEEGAGIPAQAV